MDIRFRFLFISKISKSYSGYYHIRGPLVLYRSPECIEYAELEQAWKYMTIYAVEAFHPRRSIRKQI